MADDKTDIEKYLRNELSPSERHALEKRALSDPFLADALEGTEFLDSEKFISDVAEINKRLKLKQRPWLVSFRIAAAVALLITVSYGLYEITKPQPTDLASKESATNSPATQNQTQAIDSDVQVKPAEKEKLLTFNPPPRRSKEKVPEAAKPTLQPEAVDKTIASGEPSGGASVSVPLVLSESEISPKNGASGPDEKAQEERTDQSSLSKTAEKKNKSEARRSLDEAIVSQQHVVRGKVTSAKDGAPIAGANITVAGSAQGAVSDEKGDYELVTSPQQDSLEYASIGYLRKDIKISANDSQVNVALPSSPSSKNEVAVMGIADDKSGGGPNVQQLARPEGGAQAYDIYLTKNLRYPSDALASRTEGEVIVDFTVQPNGRLTEFSIVKSLGKGCDEEAIRLLKKGPAWIPSLSAGQTVKSIVRVKVQFRIPN